MLSAGPGRFRVIIDIPSLPFSPWLRLAHQVSWGSGPGIGQGTQRRLRDWKFLLQLSGESWLWYAEAGGSWPLRPGDLALVPPGRTYAWGVPLGAHLAVHFDLHAQPALDHTGMVEITGGPVQARRLRSCPQLTLRIGDEVHRCLAVVRPPAPRRWQERFAPLVQQWARHDHARPAARLAAAGVLGEAFAAWLDLARPLPGRDAAARAAVGALLDRLAAAPPGRDLGISGLARQAGLGETAFRAAFQRLAGLPPRAWLERRRITHAAGLIREGGLGVADAAAAVGYDDPFHFTRVFRRVMGCPPRAWRQGAASGITRPPGR
jgi:AraC-like DNA-binding protein